MDIVVIYHANCWDGYCAAWLMHNVYPHARFIPAHYGNRLPSGLKNKHVYMLDFCFKESDVLDELMDKAESVMIVDHHKTVLDVLAPLMHKDPKENCQIIFDIDKSGGRLTWEMLVEQHKTVANNIITSVDTVDVAGTTLPWLVAYTEDRDLWHHALPYSKAVNAALRSYQLNFEQWDMLARTKPLSHVGDGEAILRAEAMFVNSHVRNAHFITLDGHRVPCVNATILHSEIAGKLAKDQPFGVCYFDRHDGKRQFSLRSTPDGLDVAEIAVKFGGGGHKHAAGFEIDTGIQNWLSPSSV